MCCNSHKERETLRAARCEGKRLACANEPAALRSEPAVVPPRCPSGRGRLNHYRGLGSVGRCSADRSAGARARNDTLSSGCLVCRRVGLRCARRGSRPACHLQSARLVAPVRRRTPGLAVRDLRYAARPDIRRETLHGRDGVIRFQHWRKISSLLIRDTVAPIANRTTSGSCLAMRITENLELL